MIDPVTVVIRIALALGFGALIGLEREWRQKHAGLKTMALVSLGAAAFAMMSDTFGPNNRNPGQIAAAVVGGIGFIGAGVIMHRGAIVQGVTTAATLWATASVGVAVGLGQYPLAVVLTGGVVIVQFMVRRFEVPIHRARPDAPGRFELRVDCNPESLHEVNETWVAHAESNRLVAQRRSMQRTDERITIRIVLRVPRAVNISALQERLVTIPGVHRADVRHLGLDEED